MKQKQLAKSRWTARRRTVARSRSPQAGFTLMELMIAVAVLAVGMLGTMIMMMMGMQTDSRNKTDTNATVLDQEVIELYSTLKVYPQPTSIAITDCAASTTTNIHLADVGQGASPTGNGAVLYTSATAPTTAQVGDIDWTQAAPTLATNTQAGYAMEYQTCSGDVYEVRWNVMNLSAAGSSGRLSLLTVSARQRSALYATTGGAQNRAVLFAVPVTLRTMIEQ